MSVKSMKCMPPYTPLLYSKLGYAGIYLFFLFLFRDIDCGLSLHVPTIYVLSKNKKNIHFFQMIFQFFAPEKNILHGQVFVMFCDEVRVLNHLAMWVGNIKILINF